MGWNVLVTRRIPDEGLELLEKKCETLEIGPEDRPLSRKELLSKVKGRDAVVSMLNDDIDEKVLAAAKGARGFANYAVGYDNIDVEKATDLGIMVTNTPGVLTDATADLAWALLFAASRRILEADAHVRSGKWKGWGPMQYLGRSITGTTLGVIGAGRIGTNFALKALGFGMRILYNDLNQNKVLEREVKARRVGKAELLQRSDFVALHVPYTPKTHHLIGAEDFDRMKDSAVLVNTSRGPVIDEAALVEALKKRQIASAGLDVYENEPKPLKGLTKLPNAVLLPHIGSATVGTRRQMAVMTAECVIAMLDGKTPRYLVNPEVLK
jgi:glyoxylate reductase